jgi:hypothetical protein
MSSTSAITWNIVQGTATSTVIGAVISMASYPTWFFPPIPNAIAYATTYFTTTIGYEISKKIIKPENRLLKTALLVASFVGSVTLTSFLPMYSGSGFLAVSNFIILHIFSCCAFSGELASILLGPIVAFAAAIVLPILIVKTYPWFIKNVRHIDFTKILY